MKVSLIALATIAAASPLNFAKDAEHAVVPRDEGVIPWGKIFGVFKRADDIGDNYNVDKKKGDKKKGDDTKDESSDDGEGDDEDEDADATITNLKNFRIIVDFEKDDRLVTLKQQNGTNQPIVSRYGQDARYNLVNSTLTNLNGTRIVFDVLGSFGLVNGTFNATTNTTNTTILRTLPSNSASLLVKPSGSSSLSSLKTSSQAAEVSEASESGSSSQAGGSESSSAAGSESSAAGGSESSAAGGAESSSATESSKQKRAEKEESSSAKQTKTATAAKATGSSTKSSSDAKSTGSASKESPSKGGAASSSVNATEFNSTGTIQVFAQNGTNVTSFPGWKIYENRLFYKDFTQWFACPGKNNQTYHIATSKCKGGERVKLRVFV